MKTLIIGGGAVGSIMARSLARDRSSQVVVGTNDVKKAVKFMSGKYPRIKIKKLDAFKREEIKRACVGMDLVANASLPTFNLPIMEAALAARSNYQDLCSEIKDLRHPEQLRLNKKFKEKGLNALINTGVSPGITNMVVCDAVDKLDAGEKKVKIRLLEEQKANELIFAWSPVVTLDEVTSPPLVFHSGKFGLTRPFANIEEYEFPAPYGKRNTASIYGDEISTLPLYLEISDIDYKSTGTDIDFAKALYRLGLFDKKPRKLGGRKIVPQDFFASIAPPVPTPAKMMELMKNGTIENAILIMIVEVEGKQQKKPIKIKTTITLPDLKEIARRFPGATYISYPTGIAAAAFARIVPKIKKHGVYPTETLNSYLRKEIMVDLEGTGIVIDQEFSGAAVRTR